MVTEPYLSVCIYHGYQGDWRTECISGLSGILLEDLYAPRFSYIRSNKQTLL